ncbi:MAG: DUF2600 family protein [Candidatus Eremiobacteraeota bacterium]|nr:DUF2600 family protein [Candidatus Eremiobacteraeota bacterium]
MSRVVPKARTALSQIRVRALAIDDPAFRGEALTSIRAKSYHVAGAAMLATFLPPKEAKIFIDAIAPLESLYDYLDNLCDRHPGVPAEAYPVLHEALFDALDPTRTPSNYFRAGPKTNDGGYLSWLVSRVREAASKIPEYETLLPNLREAAEFYTVLQTFKHYQATERIEALKTWHAANLPRFQGLSWWEFAAACGSQLQVYAPFFFCLAGNASRARYAYDAYFPEFCALHVLLDDFIDQEEDSAHGELNFVTRYPSFDAMRERFAGFMHISEARFEDFANPRPHEMLLRVLVLFYLTHPKIYAQGLDGQAQDLLNALRSRAPTAT